MLIRFIRGGWHYIPSYDMRISRNHQADPIIFTNQDFMANMSAKGFYFRCSSDFTQLWSVVDRPRTPEFRGLNAIYIGDGLRWTCETTAGRFPLVFWGTTIKHWTNNVILWQHVSPDSKIGYFSRYFGWFLIPSFRLRIFRIKKNKNPDPNIYVWLFFSSFPPFPWSPSLTAFLAAPFLGVDADRNEAATMLDAAWPYQASESAGE